MPNSNKQNKKQESIHFRTNQFQSINIMMVFFDNFNAYICVCTDERSFVHISFVKECVMCARTLTIIWFSWFFSTTCCCYTKLPLLYCSLENLYRFAEFSVTNRVLCEIYVSIIGLLNRDRAPDYFISLNDSAFKLKKIIELEEFLLREKSTMHKLFSRALKIISIRSSFRNFFATVLYFWFSSFLALKLWSQ